MQNAAFLPVAFEVVLIVGALTVLMVAVVMDSRSCSLQPSGCSNGCL